MGSNWLGNNWFVLPSTPNKSLLKDKSVTEIFTAAFQKVKTNRVFWGAYIQGAYVWGHINEILWF